MGKLHEVLAVEPDLKGQAQQAISRVKDVFGSAADKLVGQERTYEPLEEGGEEYLKEYKELPTTVADELALFQEAFGRYLNATLQKEVTNKYTHADVVVGDMVLFSDVPAPALLNLEARLAEIKSVYQTIPTNDPSEKWTWSEEGEYYESRPRHQFRTQKRMKSYVAYEATPEHPAQVQVYNEDERVGVWETVVKSGMYSLSDKRRCLERIDELIRAVKQARQRANDIEVELVDFDVFEYIHT